MYKFILQRRTRYTCPRDALPNGLANKPVISHKPHRDFEMFVFLDCPCSIHGSAFLVIPLPFPSLLITDHRLLDTFLFIT